MRSCSETLSMPLSKASRNGFRQGIHAVMTLRQRVSWVVMLVAKAAVFMSASEPALLMKIRRAMVVIITLRLGDQTPKFVRRISGLTGRGR